MVLRNAAAAAGPERDAPPLRVVAPPAEVGGGLFLPVVDPDADSLTIALALADAGFYVLPSRADAGARNPGSRVGAGWPSKSSTDPAQIAAWFVGSTDRVVLHCGRSGLIVADVDHADELTDELREAIKLEEPPFQSTRPDEPARGHYLFAQPPGRRIGNRAGGTGKAWGEWRGANGVILVGGEGRQWLRTGAVPVLPDAVARLLPDVGDATSAVSNAEVGRFVQAHTLALAPRALEPILRAFASAVEDGGSRHNAALSAVCWAVREAVQGRFPADKALRRLESEFVAAMARSRTAGERTLTHAQAEAEFVSVVAWAVAQEWNAPALEDGDEPREDPAADLRERAHALAVADAADRERINREGRRVVDAEERPPAVPYADLAVWDDELDTLPLPTMAVGRLVPERSVGFLGGPSGSYKSFVAVSLAACLAYGVPALGHQEFASRRAAPVLYVAGEDAPGVALRLRALRARTGVQGTRRLVLYPRAADLTAPHEVDRLAAFALEHEVGLVIVDTFRQSTPGVDENDNSGVGLVLSRLLTLRDAHGISSLFVDHTNKGAKGAADLTGAGAKRANADYVLMIDLPNGDRSVGEQRTLRVAKMKNAPEGRTWPIRLESVPGVVDADGVPSAVAVVGQVERTTASIHGDDDWRDVPVPDDVREYQGEGRQDLPRVAQLVAFYGSGESGVSRAEVLGYFRDGTPGVTQEQAKHRVRRSWDALHELRRLASISPTGSSRISHHRWVENPS